MLRFENVNVKFNNRFVLKDFSLTVEKTDKVLLSGRSGAGKSTILKSALGYLRPESGKIYYNEQQFNPEVVWQLRKDTAYVSQDMEIGSGNIQSFLKLTFSYKTNIHIKQTDEKLYELMEYFELNPDTLYKNIEELSGGEKQRFMIIISILLDRKLYFLDEITSGIDLNLKRKVISFFLSKKDLTEIIISHDDEWQRQPGMKVINIEEVNGNC